MERNRPKLSGAPNTPGVLDVSSLQVTGLIVRPFVSDSPRPFIIKSSCPRTWLSRRRTGISWNCWALVYQSCTIAGIHRTDEHIMSHSTKTKGPAKRGHIVAATSLLKWSCFPKLTLSLPSVINLKFPLQPHQKYCITQYGKFGFS